MDSRKKKNLIINCVAGIGIVSILIVFLLFNKEHYFHRYHDDHYNFSIKYPASWTLEKNKNGAAVIFYSPQEGDLDIFKESVNIVVQDIAGNPMNIKKYSKIAIEQMEAVFGDNMLTLESDPMYFAGHEGYKFVFRGKTPETDLQYMSIWTIAGLNAYQVTYTALASQYDRHLPNVNKMIRSFRLH